MNIGKINEVLEALRSHSIPAERGFPGHWKPQVTVPAAAVSLQSLTQETLTLSVQIYCPPHMGGSMCEDTAADAAFALLPLEGQFKIGPCRYDRTAGLFCVDISLSWSLLPPEAPEEAPEDPPEDVPAVLDCSVSINGSPLPYLKGFSCKESADLQQIHAIGEGTVEARRENIHWILTVEELLPSDLPPVAPESFDFNLVLTRSGGRETYTFCNWESILRQETLQGIRQVRVARSWGERRLSDG